MFGRHHIHKTDSVSVFKSTLTLMTHSGALDKAFFLWRMSFSAALVLLLLFLPCNVFFRNHFFGEIGGYRTRFCLMVPGGEPFNNICTPWLRDRDTRLHWSSFSCSVDSTHSTNYISDIHALYPAPEMHYKGSQLTHWVISCPGMKFRGDLTKSSWQVSREWNTGFQA